MTNNQLEIELKILLGYLEEKGLINSAEFKQYVEEKGLEIAMGVQRKQKETQKQMALQRQRTADRLGID